MKFISGVYWDKGKRSNNQDSLLLEQVLTKKGRVLLAAVSDGIGGLSEGEVASGFILEKLLQNFYHQLLQQIDRGKNKGILKRSLLRCFFETNQILNKYAKSRETELGATVSVLLLFRKHFLIAHLGDSRIYSFSGKNKIKQITRDHSAGNSVLTKCMGSFSYQSPDIYTGRITGKTGFLLCSDGFYHYLQEDMLAELLDPREIGGEEQIEKRLRELAGYEYRQGEQDNISALYVLCDK
ncbi:MAG: PP2C family protein-serine/threonine phosphatase [Suilimivivens sp.]